MNEPEKKKRKRKHFSNESIFIGVTVIAIVIAVVAAIGNFYIQRADSRMVLQQGKAVALAVDSIATECYGMDRKFADQSTEDGFAKGIQKEIKELSACPGDVYLLQWDDKNYVAWKFCYVQDGYAVTYELNKNQEIQWDVFRVQSKM